MIARSCSELQFTQQPRDQSTFQRDAAANVPNKNFASFGGRRKSGPLFVKRTKKKPRPGSGLRPGLSLGSSAPQEHRDLDPIPLTRPSTIVLVRNSDACDFSAKAFFCKGFYAKRLRHGDFGQIALATARRPWLKDAHGHRSPRLRRAVGREPCRPAYTGRAFFLRAGLRLTANWASQPLRTAAAVAQHSRVRPTKPISVGSMGKTFLPILPDLQRNLRINQICCKLNLRGRGPELATLLEGVDRKKRGNAVPA